MVADTKAQSRANGRLRMSDQHKAALAEGREQGRIVRRYLEAIERQDRSRARSKSLEVIDDRLVAISQELLEADPITKLKLIQERLDLNKERDSAQDGLDFNAAERAFITAAAEYGKRKGISYAAWREIGVSAAVLREAGIERLESSED